MKTVKQLLAILPILLLDHSSSLFVWLANGYRSFCTKAFRAIDHWVNK